MIPEEQIERFIKQLFDKGYTAKYSAPGTEISDLSSVLNKYLHTRLHDNVLSRAFPFWISTEVARKPFTDLHLLGHLKIEYDERKGLTVSELKLMVWDHRKDDMNVKYLQRIPSMTDMPTRAQAQTLCPLKSERQRSRKNRKL